MMVPWLLLVSGAVWAMFWNPRVVVDDGGVHLVNPLRTIDVPWPAIQNVDTKWALTLITAYGRFTAWAAPAPGGLATARKMTRTDREAIPSSARDAQGAIRPGDLPETASGSAALIIRRRWEELRDAGWLDDPRLEHERRPGSLALADHRDRRRARGRVRGARSGVTGQYSPMDALPSAPRSATRASSREARRSLALGMRFCRGSKASRRPSPMKLSASTMTMMKTLGQRNR